jgi:hypothetical protein
MDWVPDLIGTPPRREENGGDQIQKTVGVEKRGLVEQTEIETEVGELEIASQTQSFETENRETEIGETQIIKTESVETRFGKKVQIVELDEIETQTESEIPQLERIQQRLERRQHADGGRA